MVDPDAGGFVHWVMAGIDPATTGLGVDEVPDGAVQTTNDGGQQGYFGPCLRAAHLRVHALRPGDGPRDPAERTWRRRRSAPSRRRLSARPSSGEFTPSG